MSRDGGEVVPGLWVGSLAVAQNDEYLEELGIVRVLTFGKRLNPSLEWRASSTSKLSCRSYDIEDHPCADLLGVLPSAIREIDKIMNSRKSKQDPPGEKDVVDETRRPSVLVHCASGISRSVAVCTAWLMLRRTMLLQDALQMVKTARPQAFPNHGFVQCLQLLENEKGDISKASKLWLKANDISESSRSRQVSKFRARADKTAARAAELEEELQKISDQTEEGLKQLEVMVRRLKRLQKDIANQMPQTTIDDTVASSVRKNTADKVKHLLSMWEPKLPEREIDSESVSMDSPESPVEFASNVETYDSLPPRPRVTSLSRYEAVPTIHCVRKVVSLWGRLLQLSLYHNLFHHILVTKKFHMFHPMWRKRAGLSNCKVSSTTLCKLRFCLRLVSAQDVTYTQFRVGLDFTGSLSLRLHGECHG